ncbi:hypothetical protein JTB14_016053 [Gonioctena quinquepunctata]|nr:hypothetical protein JTB14_016053 [Gonioctena quinquepunctata]
MMQQEKTKSLTGVQKADGYLSGPNWVVLSKSIQTHSPLEEDSAVILLSPFRAYQEDSSTNGTCVNSLLVKNNTSPPLKHNDIIDLDRENEKYVFQHPASPAEISDEQLCRLADSLLSGVEVVPNITEPSTEDGPPPNKQINLDHSTNDRNSAIDASVVEVLITPTTDKDTSIVDLTNDSLRKSINKDGPPPNKQIKLDHSTNDRNSAQDTSVVEVLISPTTDKDTSIVDLTNDSLRKSINSKNVEPEIVAGPSKIPDESLPKVEESKTYADVEDMEDEILCPICSEMYVKAVTLGCSHTFCKFCIEMWKKKKMVCPICRTKITSLVSTLVLDNLIEKESYDPNTGMQHNTRNQSIIELSSSSSTELDSDYDDDEDTDNWRDDYDEDNWYEQGDTGGAYYGGYGHCFSCGRRGHWSNGCPYR